MKSPYIIFILLAISLFSAGCSNTKFLKDNQSLLVKIDVELETSDDYKDKRKLGDEIDNIPIQRTNTKAFGLARLKLSFFNAAHYERNDSTETGYSVFEYKVVEDTVKNRTIYKPRFRKWVEKTLGEPPAIFDSTITTRSMADLKAYMANKGYFYNSVEVEIKTKKQKTRLTYKVKAGTPYLIDSIFIPQGNLYIEKMIREYWDETELISGDPFDVSVLKDERVRLSDLLRSKGYYFFSPNLISFDLDSSDGNKTIDIYVKVNNLGDSLDHEIYYMNKVVVYIDYTLSMGTGADLDTTVIGEYLFIHEPGKSKLKPKILMESIFHVQDDYYKLKNHQSTIRRLSQLGVFRFINVEYKVLENDDPEAKKYLNCIIYLTLSKKQAFTVDLSADNDFEQSLLGTGTSFTYRNKNLSRSADQLVLNAAAGVQFKFSNAKNPVSIVDVSGEASYYISRFLLPFDVRKFSASANPKTKISLQYGFESRVALFKQHTVGFSFGYEYNEVQNVKWIFNPINISYQTIPFRTDSFDRTLMENPSIRRSFDEQFIVGPSVTYIRTTKDPQEKNYENYIEGFGEVTFNFAKVTGEYKHYFTKWDHSLIATRVYLGAGLPYGNKALPYSRLFSAGGPNGLRAYEIYTMGPGSFSPGADEGNNLIQTGEIKFEANAEYRFDIISFLKGALFVDAGNVWLWDEDPDRPGGKLTADFVNDIAIGTGFGIRLDFDYFQIRTDWGIPVKDPRMPAGEQWVIQDFDILSKAWRKENLHFNLGLGYPF